MDDPVLDTNSTTVDDPNAGSGSNSTSVDDQDAGEMDPWDELDLDGETDAVDPTPEAPSPPVDPTTLVDCKHL